MADDNTQDPTAAMLAPPAEAQSGHVITPEIEALIRDREAKARDAAFAEARRTFEGKSKPNQRPSQPATPAPTSNSDDLAALLRLRDELDDAVGELRLTTGQRQILRDSVLTSRPEAVAEHVKTFVEKAGWVTNPQPNPTQSAAPQRSGPPASNGGVPPISKVPVEEQDIASMSPEDRIHLQKTKGDRWFMETFRRQQAGRSFTKG
jgi:hypothetical protein